MPQLLQWTGSPLVDVGIAAVCAMVGRNAPEELTLEDLDSAAREMEECYFSGLLGSYLTCVFMNSEYVQPGGGPKKIESRKNYAKRVLFAHRSEPDQGAGEYRCVFSGLQATHLIHRGQMPMLTGEGVLNFYPSGTGALPISGPYLAALQALPMGGRRAEGRLLIAHSDNGALTLELARLYVEDNRRLFALCRSGRLPSREGPDETLAREQAAWDATKKKAKYPDAKSAASLVTADLIEVWDTKGVTFQEVGSASITVYWLSSSGQGPSLEMYHLPSNLIRFLVLAGAPNTRPQWHRLMGRGWQSPTQDERDEAGTATKKRRKVSSTVTGGPGRSRNLVLADLFSVYESGFIDLRAAAQFLRRHVLSELRGKIEHPGDCDWTLTGLFLREVFGMEPERIAAIRSFADRLAEHVKNRNDRRLFRDLIYAKRSSEVRNALTKAQRNEAREKNQLLFGLEEYLQVFEAEDSVGRLEWGLTRDLISIRLVEQLQKASFLSKDMLSEEEENADTPALAK
jgi:CRISPR-associated protein Cst1